MNKDKVKKSILGLLSKPNARPLTKSELARELGIVPKNRAEFRGVISELITDGSLKLGKKARLEVAPKDEGGKGLLVGRIRVFPKGHATVYPDDGDEANAASGFDLDVVKRVFVPDNRTGVALDGDTVQVRVTLKRGRDGDIDPHGVVERVVRRSDRLIVGVYFHRNGHAYIQPDSEALPQTLSVDPFEEAKEGQKVGVQLIEWRKGEDPRGRVKEVIGWPESPGVDILSVVHKYGLQIDFPERVQEQANQVAVQVPDSEKARREDWTGHLVITIDPADAKDHDDAIWVTQKAGGGWTLAVHIADVSHYVKPGTYLDKEAVKRGNSTYLVDRVLPMLPETLSNGICSLRPDEVRLTKCAVMEFDRNGLMTRSHFVDAFINSQAKLSYEDAQVVLDGGSVPPRFTGVLKEELEEMIPEAWNLAKVLRKRRFKRGALDMEMDEIKVLVDESTKEATGFKKVEHCESHQLIEEFMLAANETVAEHVQHQKLPFMYRIHDEPKAERLDTFFKFIANFGINVERKGESVTPKTLQTILNAVEGEPEEAVVSTVMLRSLQQAKYDVEPIGHFGLVLLFDRSSS